MYNPAGKNSEHAKWVELVNLSAQKIVLYPTGSETSSGWKIKDLKITDSSSHYLYTAKNVPLEIDSGDFLIITDNVSNFNNDYPDFSHVILLKSAVTLTTADSGGFYHLTLYDDNNVLDGLAYSKDWYPNTDDKGKSLEKADLSADNEKENWQESCGEKGTPGSEPQTCKNEPDPPISSGNDDESGNSGGNISVDVPSACATTSSNIVLSEIFPYPAGSNEFVEIKNTGADCVNVSGWKVMDEAGHKKTFPENSIIGPGKYLYLEGNLYLNNDSDTAYLLDANGNAKNDALDKVFYEKAKENYSYALSDGSFFWTSAPTPGEKNVITTPESAENDRDHQSPEQPTKAIPPTQIFFSMKFCRIPKMDRTMNTSK